VTKSPRQLEVEDGGGKWDRGREDQGEKVGLRFPHTLQLISGENDESDTRVRAEQGIWKISLPLSRQSL